MAPRGGKRSGAGRPKSEATKQMRLPASRIAEVYALLEGREDKIALPLYSTKVQAGFPSPADDYIERYLDLNSEFIKHPAATFLLKATGESMIEAGIYPDDVLIVDKSITPVDGAIVIAALNGELTVKRLSRANNRVRLLPANPKFHPIDVTEDQEMVIWGVVTLVLHKPS
ncbi:MAG: translesion error-prone DNA polymerase V autoproteolytic subunit [bacterium]|nr:translesion error-prone DNA polymerase V autoproteolytic subunit [bacterium]